jgi:AcrR family transcriptional regulator
MTPAVAAKDGPYHHGRLSEALIDIAIDLIAERGVQTFSLAEASRRLGVSVAAPYRHYADRESLLTAVAIRACETLSDRLRRATRETPDATAQLAALCAAYVQFAHDHRPLFDVLFGSGLVKEDRPELQSAGQPIVDAFLAPCAAILGSRGVAAQQLSLAIAATAHGHASMFIDQTNNAKPSALHTVQAQASAAARALVSGRAALTSQQNALVRGSHRAGRTQSL